MKVYKNIFEKIISPESLFTAWEGFRKDKGRRGDVMAFEFLLEQNIFNLHNELKTKSYKHSPYHSFFIQDPKQRHIHKAEVKDRLVHHAVFSVLNPLFEPTFIDFSFSCRKGKGTHKGVETLGKILRTASRNNTKPCFVLKCDIRKFFRSVDHKILFSIIEERVKDLDVLWLVREIIESFPDGVPIGNLTSQLFANVYLNRLDQFVKNKLKVRFYLRYTDDFILVSDSPDILKSWLAYIKLFLEQSLKLQLHPNKVVIRKYHQGIDFLGYVQFPKFRILRNKTKRRVIKKLYKGMKEPALNSYLGILSHCDAGGFSDFLKNQFWLQRSVDN